MHYEKENLSVEPADKIFLLEKDQAVELAVPDDEQSFEEEEAPNVDYD